MFLYEEKPMKKIFILISVLFATSALAAAEYDGLVCDNENDERTKVEISVRDNGTARVVIMNPFTLRPINGLVVDAEAVQAILDNDLAAMNEVTIEGNGATMSFKTRGRNVEGQSKLLVEFNKAGETIVLTNCQASRKIRVEL
jgi:hypothetical protein